MDNAIKGALAAAALGLPVFPLKAGTKDHFVMRGSWKSYATTDERRIIALGAMFPGCNWGMRCAGHLVLDVDVADGKRGLDSLALLDIEHDLPRTRAQRSARGGQHIIMRLPPGVEVSNRDAPIGEGVNVRGTGGYIVCAGSTFEGKPYTLATDAAIAEAPASLIELLRAPAAKIGADLPPEHMDHPSDIKTAIAWLERRETTVKGERGAAIYKAATRLRDWGISQDVAHDLIAEHFAPNMLPPADYTFCTHEVKSAYNYAQNSVGAKSVFVDFDDVSELAAELAAEAEAAGAGPIDYGEMLRWPAVNDDGKPYAKNLKNIKAVLQHLGVTLTRDAFAGVNRIKGFGFDGALDDAALRALHMKAFALGLACPKDHFHDALFDFARQNETHPVREYLAALEWDGVPRVGSWLVNYMKAEDTPLNREFARLWLTAAVRRVKRPGCKFDAMLVLEGGQGVGKSTALRYLAHDWCEDSMQISADPKVVIEQTRGKWIVEIAELSGMGHRDVEHVKATITRTEDTARLSYERVASTVPRQFILAATTNDSQYLRDTTGNRRFWPVKVGEVDLEGLKHDRDQLWAEAVAIEAKGGSLVLPVEMRAAAAVAQGEREAPDPLREMLEPVFAAGMGYMPCVDVWPFAGWSQAMGRTPNAADAKRLSSVMRQLGWQRTRRRHNGKPVYCFERWPESATATAPVFNPSGPSGPTVVAENNDGANAARDLLS